MDVLTSMQVFRRVVELRSFSAAARALRISKAATSKHVSALEEHVGAVLLERTTRRMALTPTGSLYYDRCTRVLDDLDEAEQAARQATGSPRGLLRVSAPLAFGLSQLSSVICEFKKAWPEIELDLSLNDRFVDLVEEGVDVAVRITSELPDSSSLIAQRLVKTRLVACASPRFLKQHGVPKRLADLSRLPCIEYSLTKAPGELWFEKEDGKVTRVSVHSQLRINNSLLLRDAALSGLGFIYVPLFYVQQELDKGGLREVLPDVRRKPVYVHVVYPRHKHLSARLRTFIEFLKERLVKAPWAS